MAKYAHQRRSEPIFEHGPTADQSLGSGEHEPSLRTIDRSSGASVSEEQGLVANAARSGTRQSVDVVEEALA